MFPGLTNLKTNTPPQPNMTGLGSDNKNVAGIATQNLGGNSQTQQLRSVDNYLSGQGAASYQQGQDVTNAALPGFGVAGDTTGTALGTTGTALDTTNKALDTLSPAESYWSKLLSGDQHTMNEAISPYATQAGTNYANAMTSVNQNTARGGFAGALSAGIPQAQARDVSNQLYSLQPTAATNLNTIAGTKNQIAGTQGQIGGIQNQIASTQGQLANWLASLGIDISKLGLTGLSDAASNLLGMRGQDVQEHGQAMQMATSLAGDVLNPAGQVVVKKTIPGVSTAGAGSGSG